MDFADAVKNRRSIYSITDEKALETGRVFEIVGHALMHTPSPYNLQQGRALILFGDEHLKLWDIVIDTLRPRVSADRFLRTERKLLAFKAGFGTVLFFNDRKAVEALARQYPKSAERFLSWADQSNGMLQYIVWTHLEAEGLGSSLQHYNPLIDEKVKAAWEVPEGWELISQMPFGKPASEAGDKEFLPLEGRLYVRG